MMTHEDYVQAVKAIGVARVPESRRAPVEGCKLVYGIGAGYYRGITCHGSWSNGHPEPVAVVEIAATGEESPLQLAGTTLHELGHVLAGRGLGHGAEWKAACMIVGLRRAIASGQAYGEDDFYPDAFERIAALPAPTDGKPDFQAGRVAGTRINVRQTPRPCSQGYGTQGGQSRGPGSGSRMVPLRCAETDCAYRVRITRKWLDAAEYGAPECPLHKVKMIEPPETPAAPTAPATGEAD